MATAGVVVPGLDNGESPPPAPVPQGSAPEANLEGLDGFDVFEESEAREIARVLDAIESGEPLRYEEDGQMFQNREGLLPSQPIGYYSEYTVETPGSPDRGARRLVIGDSGETYYTRDHYASFTRIDPETFGP